jgi:hypothetical protein
MSALLLSRPMQIKKYQELIWKEVMSLVPHLDAAHLEKLKQEVDERLKVLWDANGSTEAVTGDDNGKA